MIVTRLIGGLGNQMFQYALGRKLAFRHGVELKLDTTGFEVYKLHNYALSNFNVADTLATGDELKRFRPGEDGKTDGTVINEKDLSFDATVLDAPADCYLFGYWQCEKYFADIAQILRQEFAPRAELTGTDRELVAQMRASESVSIHVRRGDYVSNPQTNAVHGVCDLAYYDKAVGELQQRGATHYFVFSDDPVWCQSNLKLPGPMTVISHNGPDRNFADLYLMSQCKQHIIANSSFSWWGAWLDENPNKLVIAPSRWFVTDEYNAKDIVPESWLRL